MDIRKLGNGLPNIFESQDQNEAQEVQQTQKAGLATPIADIIEQVQVQQPLQKVMMALTPGQEIRIPNEDRMPVGPEFAQKNQMACGTTSLSYLFALFGKNISPAEIDDAIRRREYGAVPNDLIEFARDHGLEAEGYNNGSIDELKSFIDKGIPCQVLIDPRGTNKLADQHYVDVTGYGKNPDGPEYIIYHDPADGAVKQMPMEDFKEKWGDLFGGFNNYFIAYAPKGTDLPAGRDDGIEALLPLADAGMNVVNGWDRLTGPDSVGEFFHGLFELPGGIVQGIGAGIGFGLQRFSNWMNNGVEGIPVIENLVQPFGDLINMGGAVLGHVFGGIGEAFDDVGGAFESLFEGDFGGFASGIGEAVADVAGGVVDAVGDVVEGVGEAIGDLFSGW